MAEKNPVLDPPAHVTAIRNVVVIGPAGSGKTTLFDALLAEAGAIPAMGSVADGTTVSDTDDAEKRSERSIHLSVAAFDYSGVRINLIDTPGYAEFAGEVGAGLRAADAALFVVPAHGGLDAATRLLWEQCASVGMPRAIVVTKVDAGGSAVGSMVEELRSALGAGVIAFELPLGEDVIDLLTHEVHHHAQGKHSTRAATAEEIQQADALRRALLEAVISEAEDEALMEQYLDEQELDPIAVRRDIVAAVAHGHFHPVLFTSVVASNYGVAEVLDLIVNGLPNPTQHSIPAVMGVGDGKPRSLEADPSGPLVAEVFKTMTDPYLGRISLVRVFSGTLNPNAVVHVSGHFSDGSGHEDHDVDEKVGGLTSPLGRTMRQVAYGFAGDIVAVAKLTRAETGDTLSAKNDPVIMPAWSMPEPWYPIAIKPHAAADEDKLAQALHRLILEDPAARLERNPITHQTVLWTLGETHAEVLLDRLRNRSNVHVDQVEFTVALRETFTTSAQGHGRLVKQSGGHGQYAVCDIIVEPVAEGTGFVFSDEVVGGAVPRNYIPSVEHGVRDQMTKGLVSGNPVVDIKVRLMDGKAHSVDSSDMAFQQAGALALQDAASKATITLLEPIAEVTIEVDEAHVGAVMSELSSRRGRITGTDAAELSGRAVLSAHVPELELVTFAPTLRAISHGSGVFTRRHLSYEPLPQAKVAAMRTASQ